VSKKRKRGGAMVAILDENQKLLILKRPAWVSWAPGKWGFPGGAVEAGETPMDAAIRETKEETTLDVKNLRGVGLHLPAGLHAFYTDSYNGTVKIDYEHEDWKWAPRNEIENYDLAPNLLAMYDWVLNHG
jgi:8-oxo-dGTP diphosphatase